MGDNSWHFVRVICHVWSTHTVEVHDGQSNLSLDALLMQVELVEEQLKLAARAAEDDMEGEEKSSDKLLKVDETGATSSGDDETQMDCG